MFSQMGMKGGGGRRGGGMPGGMPQGFEQLFQQQGGGRRQNSSRHVPAKAEVQLPCTLEVLYTGATKKLKVTRRLRDGGTQEKILQVSIQPGWKKATTPV